MQVLQLAQLQLPPQVGDFTEKHIPLRGHLLQLGPEAHHLVGQVHRRHLAEQHRQRD